MRIFRRIAALCSLVIAGCGGGGGGGGGDSFSIGPLYPSTVVTTVPNIQTGTQQQVYMTAPFNGSTYSGIYLVVVDPDGVFVSGTVDATRPDKAVLTLEMSGVVPMGHYTQPLIIHLCHDPQCNHEFDSFPRTVPKDVTVQGTTTDVSSLSFTSSGGIAATSQSVKVTLPAAGTDYDLQASPYVDSIGADGSSSPTATFTTNVFAITKTATGFDVQGLGSAPGHYKATVDVVVAGYQVVPVTLDYQVGAITTPVITSLTSSVSGTARVGMREDVPVYVEFVSNLTGSPLSDALVVTATNGSADPGSTFWLRDFGRTWFTYGSGPTGNASRMLFYFNPCLFSCLPAGHYTANIMVTESAYDASTTITVPATFDITP